MTSLKQFGWKLEVQLYFRNKTNLDISLHLQIISVSWEWKSAPQLKNRICDIYKHEH